MQLFCFLAFPDDITVDPNHCPIESMISVGIPYPRREDFPFVSLPAQSIAGLNSNLLDYFQLDFSYSRSLVLVFRFFESR